ncbi:unnamed protein product [Hermetia illucens]|uniref:Uncharacterized protein n=1 Tax=Hermetia illucens TaxID=343691 RepID=A0A7R8UQB8_HERIL|nr:unnamed protein product [Hermetia illucens]
MCGTTAKYHVEFEAQGSVLLGTTREDQLKDHSNCSSADVRKGKRYASLTMTGAVFSESTNKVYAKVVREYSTQLEQINSSIKNQRSAQAQLTGFAF